MSDSVNRAENGGWVVVVEDDDDVRLVIQAMIEALAFRAIGFSSVTALQEWLASSGGVSPVAVIIGLDLRGGGTCLESLSLMQGSLPAGRIVSSGNVSHSVMIRFSDYGFDARLRKPYDLHELRQALETVIAKRWTTSSSENHRVEV